MEACRGMSRLGRRDFTEFPASTFLDESVVRMPTCALPPHWESLHNPATMDSRDQLSDCKIWQMNIDDVISDQLLCMDLIQSPEEVIRSLLLGHSEPGPKLSAAFCSSGADRITATSCNVSAPNLSQILPKPVPNLLTQSPRVPSTRAWAKSVCQACS